MEDGHKQDYFFIQMYQKQVKKILYDEENTLSILVDDKRLHFLHSSPHPAQN